MIDKDDSERKSPGLERLEELFENSPVALTLADMTLPDVPLVVANRAFCDLSGFSRDEIVGRNCRFLQDDLDNIVARAEVREVLARAGQGQVVLRNRRKDGEAFDNLLFLQALIERDGTTRYFLGSQFLLERSVTERRIESHLAQIDLAVARAVETQMNLRAEQRRMFANAAHAVANAWLALR